MTISIKRIWKQITTILVSLAVILTLTLVGVRLIGLDVFTVLSGSMEPTYPTGSLIYVQKTQLGEIKPGDVITFALNEDLIATHRVVDLVPNKTNSQVLFQTKGDANDKPDAALVDYQNVIGKPVMVIPKLGYLTHFIQNPPGRYAAIAVGAGLLLLVFLPDLFEAEEKLAIADKDT